MSLEDRIGGPANVVRPFAPAQRHEDCQKAVVEALDHIARALSAIDHNLAVLVARLDGVKRLAASLDGKAL